MRVQHVGYRVKGSCRLADYALRWGMLGQDAHQRLAILRFWQRHGLAATSDGVSFAVKRTLQKQNFRRAAGETRRAWPIAPSRFA
jgi:hypothetical protein